MLWVTAVWASALGAAGREIVRAFPVQPGAALKLDSYRAIVTVEESERPEIRVAIVMDVEADTEKAARRLREGVRIEFEAEGNTVAIRTTNPRETGVRFDWGEEDRVDLIYRITVPRECSVDLRATEGNFVVGSLSGRMKARLGTGPIFFRRIDGSVEAQTDVGDIVVSRCSGAVTARVRQGSIRLGTIGGAVDARNSTGDIEIMTALASATAAAEVGDITVGFGPQLSGDSRLSVSGGNVFAKIHSAAACRIEASATWGRVECALPLEIASGATGQRRLTGRLNGGGPLVSLRASGGSVKITSDVVLFDET